MNSTAELQVTLEQITKTEELVADEVERIFVLKSAHLNAEREETKLRELCAKLASHRAKFATMIASVKAYRLPERLLQETADIGGPRWRIGWGGLV